MVASDRALVGASLAGDASAFSVLIDRHVPRARALVRLRASDRIVAPSQPSPPLGGRDWISVANQSGVVSTTGGTPQSELSSILPLRNVGRARRNADMSLRLPPTSPYRS
jgi:hypothetical protein